MYTERFKIPFKFPPNRVGIRNSTDYSPFGVELDGRTVSVEGYRFGYQGSEKDNEFKGEVNSYTTEFRQLNPRLERHRPQKITTMLDRVVGKICLMQVNGQNY